MKTVNKIHFIGDVHGRFDEYLKIIQNLEATIQVGDFGFKRAWDRLNRVDDNFKTIVDPEYHKIIPGNHEDYEYINKYKPDHNIGDFGIEYFHGLNFFFLRGAYSVDIGSRLPGNDWFEDEQLGYLQLERAINEYEKFKPEIVITHTLPSNVTENIFKNMLAIHCSTSSALQDMFNIHKPKLWICGHFHPEEVVVKDIVGTTFVILPTLKKITYDLKLTLEQNIEKYKNDYDE